MNVVHGCRLPTFGIANLSILLLGLLGGVSTALAQNTPLLIDGDGSVVISGETRIHNQVTVSESLPHSKLTIQNAGRLEGGVGNTIGFGRGAVGTAIVTGVGSQWTQYSMRVGIFGTGTLMIENGGGVSTGVDGLGGIGSIGEEADSNGNVIVNGSGSNWTLTHQLRVGIRGTGNLTIEDGGEVSALYANIGGGPDGVGTVTVTGPGSYLDASSRDIQFTLGSAGKGTLTIADGGRVHTNPINIASSAGSEGRATVIGAGSEWTSTGGLSVGGSHNFGPGGDGTLTIGQGGIVSTEPVATEQPLFARTSKVYQSGAIDIQDGGTLANGSSLTNAGLIEIASGGLMSVEAGVVNTGTITNHGMFTGDITNIDGGLLSGGGMFEGTVTVGEGGFFSPGNSPGTASSTATVWESGGTYLWEINALEGFGGVEGGDPGWDLWHTGDLTVDGPFTIALTTLTLDNEAGLLADWSPFIDQQWRIATATNGAFSFLDNLWLDTSGFLNAFGDGTFRLDSSASGNDLYLSFTSGEAASEPVVPEPSSLLLMALGVVGLVVYRCRRRTNAESPANP